MALIDSEQNASSVGGTQGIDELKKIAHEPKIKKRTESNIEK
jgi:hypothetical protein